MYIIVIGDIILDVYHNVETNRKAPEADIPVYNVLNTNYILGGASNVANNIKNLSGNVHLISIIGNDKSGDKVYELLEKSNIGNRLFIDNRQTTTKYRCILNNQIVHRHDIEQIEDINSYLETSILEYIYSFTSVDAIVISDYNKGLLTRNLCESIILHANNNGIPTFVDPKTGHFMKYKNCFCFKPNLLEGQIISSSKDKSTILHFLKETLNCQNVLLTCGEEGMYLNNLYNHIKIKNKVDVIDVTGCGDIVLSVLVYSYLKNKDLLKASKISNFVASQSIQTVGNYIIKKEDLDNYIEDVLYDNEIEKLVQLKKKNLNKKVIFTNGCFDIVHSGHIGLLHFAKKQCDILIVGLNGDESIKRLKGESRPIHSIHERCALLQKLEIIDYIIIFNDNTPLHILNLLRPHTILKGGDYQKENIIGIDYVKDVIIYDYIEGVSSSITIDKINKNNIFIYEKMNKFNEIIETKNQIIETENKELHFYNDWHLGDNVFNCIYFHHIKVYLEENNIQLFYYLQDQYINQISEFVPSKNIHLCSIQEKKGFHLWIGNNEIEKSYFKYPLVNNKKIFDKLLPDFFEEVSKKFEIPFTIKKFGYCDIDLLIRYQNLNEKYKNIDILFINSIPFSGQIDYNEETWSNYIQRINQKYKIVTTKKVENINCTLDDNLSIKDIAAISTNVKVVIAINTGPMSGLINYYTLNNVKKFYIFDRHVSYNYENFEDKINIEDITEEELDFYCK